MFALGDPSEPEFSEECDHAHDLMCNDYERLYHLEILMKNAFSDPEVVFYSSDERKINATMCMYLWSQSMLETSSAKGGTPGQSETRSLG